MKRFFDLARRLRREKFDHAVLLQNAFGAALIARAAGTRNIAGYATDGRGTLLHTKIPFEPDYKNRHQVFYYLNIAAKLEEKLNGESRVDLNNASPQLSASEEAKEKMLQLLAESGIEKTFSHNRILAINPGATNSRAKQWIAERFAQTADLLAERDGFQTVIIGTAGDLEVASEVASCMRTRAAMLAGRTSISELKAVLACSSLVLSNDTGAAHVSAALGVPTVVVFGPTEHFATRPFSPVAEIVRHKVECSPCMLRECPIDHRCMTRVEVDQVYQTARTLI
jgi:heptosyltransferase-2